MATLGEDILAVWVVVVSVAEGVTGAGDALAGACTDCCCGEDGEDDRWTRKSFYRLPDVSINSSSWTRMMSDD